jgi:hypothetical protein
MNHGEKNKDKGKICANGHFDVALIQPDAGQSG